MSILQILNLKPVKATDISNICFNIPKQEVKVASTVNPDGLRVVHRRPLPELNDLAIMEKAMIEKINFESINK